MGAYYPPYGSSPFYTPLISSSLQSASTHFSTISTAQSPLGSPLVTRQPPHGLTPLFNSPSIVLLYLLSAPPFYIPSQHSFFTTSLPPFYPLYVSTPYSLSILPSILLSTVPLYNPFLQLVVPLVTRQPLHMTKSHLMLHLHSPSLSPLYSSPFYIPFSTSPFYTPLISSFYNLPLHPFLQLVQLNRRWAPHWSQDKPPI